MKHKIEEKLTPSAWKVLQLLAKYRFLTVGHFMELGFSDRSNCHKVLKLLRSFDKPLIGMINFPVLPTVGRYQSFFFISHRGYEFLKNTSQLEVIKYVPKPVAFSNDYMHRFHTLSALIALEKSCEGNDTVMEGLQTYFDPALKAGDRKFQPNTYLAIDEQSGLAPDALFHVKKVTEQGQLETHGFCFELYNGLDLVRTVTALEAYLSLHASGTASDHFGIEFGVPVLLVFEKRRLLERVYKHISTAHIFEYCREYFWMIELDILLNKDLQSRWIDGNGEIRRV